jgi:trans-2,3-dihydro-3-hydroxyanthranilate isomerase
MSSLNYQHVDVFSKHPYSGNSLAVFSDASEMTAKQMLSITQELRHFESIFLESLASPQHYKARVFDQISELDFAGHPIIGAACVLHALNVGNDILEWTIQLNKKTVTVTTHRTASGFSAVLNQGTPTFHGQLSKQQQIEFAHALNIDVSDINPEYVPEVISTGLRYLVFPVNKGLERARIVHRMFDKLLQSVNAEFVYVIDINTLEARHWNNDGLLEDVATGSGAGTAAAYMVKHCRVEANQEWIIRQGRFTGRPSEIRVQADGEPSNIDHVFVGGEVTLVGHGTLNVLPE